MSIVTDDFACRRPYRGHRSTTEAPVLLGFADGRNTLRTISTVGADPVFIGKDELHHACIEYWIHRLRRLGARKKCNMESRHPSERALRILQGEMQPGPSGQRLGFPLLIACRPRTWTNTPPTHSNRVD
jgi:hypothetical protein